MDEDAPETMADDTVWEGQVGFTIWISGPAGLGNRPLATHLKRELEARGHGVVVLDSETAQSGPQTHLGRFTGSFTSASDAPGARMAAVASALASRGVAVIALDASRDPTDWAAGRQVTGSRLLVYVRGEPLMPRSAQSAPSARPAQEDAQSATMPAGDAVDEILPQVDVVVDLEHGTHTEAIAKILAALVTKGYVAADTRQR